MMYDSPVTFVLLLMNGLIGAYTLFVDPSLIERWSFRPYVVRREREYGRWITAGFLHVGLAHLAFNLLSLYSLGPYVEAQLGPWRYLALYLGSDLAANALTYGKYRDNPTYSAVGASGAISGVVFSFVLFQPFATLILFPIPIPIWAIVFGVLYLVISTYAARQGGERRGGVAHEAHLGGALGGIALTLLLYPDALRIFLRQLGL